MTEDIKQPTESPVDEVTTETVTEPQESLETPAEPGSKTDPVLLLRNLQEERKKRRELEDQIRSLQTPSEAFSDEGKLLESKIQKLEAEIKLTRAVEKYPALKDKMSDFEEYRRDYEGVDLDKVAKLFLVEKDLLEPVTPRKGLEPAAGGQRTAQKQGLSSEDIKDLRNNNPRKYLQMVKEGKIRFD